MSNYEFIPFKSVGPFQLETPIAEYTKKYRFDISPADDVEEWDTYLCQDPDIELYVEDGIVAAISCWEDCMYMGQNVIGMSIPEFEKFSGTKHDSVDNLDLGEGEIYDVYEFDTLGLQAWVSFDTIVNVICGPDIMEVEGKADQVEG